MKKLLVFVMVFALLSMAISGCATPTSTTSSSASSAAVKETFNLKLWGSQEDQAMLQTMVNAFKVANSDAIYNITFGVVGEGEAKTKLLEDTEAAADVFQFANDQINDLVKAGALYEITRNKDAIIAANVALSVDASTVNGKLYAYPSTADNGYFLYYDKSILTAEDVKSLDKMLEVAKAKNRKVFMDVSNGYYIASFFLGAGCKLTVANGKQVCDFNSANGVLAGEAIKAFTANSAFLTGDDALLTGKIGTTIVAGISGIWNATAISAKLGANYAATKLPTFNLGGKQTQMSSFAGFKLVGVNSQTDSPIAAMKLAEWLTNEANQVVRFNTRQMGPSNKIAAENAAVKANVALAALAMQNQYAASQKDVLGTYWAPAEAFGTEMEGKKYTGTMKSQLDKMVEQIQK